MEELKKDTSTTTSVLATAEYLIAIDNDSMKNEFMELLAMMDQSFTRMLVSVRSTAYSVPKEESLGYYFIGFLLLMEVICVISATKH